MTRDELLDALDKVSGSPDVQLAMRARCAVQGHSYAPTTIWRGGFPGPFTRISYLQCEWCGKRK